MSSRKSLSLICVVAVAALLLPAVSAQGASSTWTGVTQYPSDSIAPWPEFNLASNWSAGVPNGVGDIATFNTLTGRLNLQLTDGSGGTTSITLGGLNVTSQRIDMRYPNIGSTITWDNGASNAVLSHPNGELLLQHNHVLNSSVEINKGSGQTRFSRLVSGAGGFILSGGQEFVLGETGTANTFAGGVTLGANTRLDMRKHAAMGTGALTFASTANVNTAMTPRGGWSGAFANDIMVDGPGKIREESSGTARTFSGDISGNGSLTIEHKASNWEFTGAHTGNGSLTINGTGRVYLSQGGANIANTFTGPFTLAQGELAVRASGWKDATGYGTFTQLSDTSIYLDANNWQTLNNSHYTLNGNLSVTSQNHTNNLRLATGNATLGSSLVANMEAGSTLWIPGNIDDGGNGYGITVAGGGGVVLGGTNTYTGKTIILSGTLAAGSAFSDIGVAGPLGAPTGANAIIDIYNGATLAYRGPQGTVSTNRPINLAGSGPGTWTISANGNDTTLALNGAITATATGPMTLDLRLGDAGNGDRERLTVVNAGIPNASDGSPLSLNVTCRTQTGSQSYVTLNGANAYTGSTRLEQTSTGSTGYFTLGATGGMLFDIDASGVNNSIYAAGSRPWVVNLDGAFTFDLTGAGTTFGDLWQIVDPSGGLLTANYGGTFSVVGFTADPGGDLWALNSGGTNYQFSESAGALSVLASTGGAIPEPATMCALGMAIAGLGGYIRKRRRR